MSRCVKPPKSCSMATFRKTTVVCVNNPSEMDCPSSRFGECIAFIIDSASNISSVEKIDDLLGGATFVGGTEDGATRLNVAAGFGFDSRVASEADAAVTFVAFLIFLDLRLETLTLTCTSPVSSHVSAFWKIWHMRLRKSCLQCWFHRWKE